MRRGARSGSFGCGAGEHSKSRPAGLTGIQEAEPDARKAFTGGPRCTSGYPIAQWQGGRRPSRWHGSTRDRRSAQRRHDAASCPGRRAGRPWPAAVSLMLPGDFLRETRAMRCDDVRPLCASAKSSYSSLDMLAGCAYTCLLYGGRAQRMDWARFEGSRAPAYRARGRSPCIGNRTCRGPPGRSC